MKPETWGRQGHLRLISAALQELWMHDPAAASMAPILLQTQARSLAPLGQMDGRTGVRQVWTQEGRLWAAAALASADRRRMILDCILEDE
jgi:hypothetical protein